METMLLAALGSGFDSFSSRSSQDFSCRFGRKNPPSTSPHHRNQYYQSLCYCCSRLYNVLHAIFPSSNSNPRNIGSLYLLHFFVNIFVVVVVWLVFAFVIQTSGLDLLTIGPSMRSSQSSSAVVLNLLFYILYR
jgi:hypothetical protein